MTIPNAADESAPLITAEPNAGVTPQPSAGCNVKCGEQTDATTFCGGLASMAIVAAAKGSIGAILGGGIAGCITGAACSLFAANCKGNNVETNTADTANTAQP